MKLRCFSLIAFLCFVSSLAYGQGLSGKWETNQAATAQPAVPAPDAADQAIELDLTVDADDKISGTVRQMGNTDRFDILSGTVTGKLFTFKTSRKLNGRTINETWDGEMTDYNTLRVTRTRSQLIIAAPRGRGGFGGIVPVDPGPRTRTGGADLIFHRPQAKPSGGTK